MALPSVKVLRVLTKMHTAAHTHTEAIAGCVVVFLMLSRRAVTISVIQHPLHLSTGRDQDLFMTH